MYATGISRDGGTIGIQMNVNVLSMADAMVTQTTLKQDKSVKDDVNVDVGEIYIYISCQYTLNLMSSLYWKLDIML